MFEFCRRRLIAVFVCALVVAAPGATMGEEPRSAILVAQLANDHMIVAGERIGPIRLGMALSELYSAMGEPSRVTRFTDGYRIEYNWPDGINAEVNVPGKSVPEHPYIAEKAQLDAEQRRVTAAYDANVAMIKDLKGRVGIDRAKFRIGNFLGALQAWRDKVVACPQDGEAAATCLTALWQRYP